MNKEVTKNEFNKQLINEKKYYTTPQIKEIGSLKNLTKGGSTAYAIDNLDGQLFES